MARSGVRIEFTLRAGNLLPHPLQMVSRPGEVGAIRTSSNAESPTLGTPNVGDQSILTLIYSVVSRLPADDLGRG